MVGQQPVITTAASLAAVRIFTQGCYQGRQQLVDAKLSEVHAALEIFKSGVGVEAVKPGIYFRFDVTVNDPSAVRCHQGTRNLNRYIQHLAYGNSDLRVHLILTHVEVARMR